MRRLIGLGLVLALALAIGCSPRREAGSESHFLPCANDTDCDALVCTDGLCREEEASPDASTPEPDASAAAGAGAGGAGAAGAAGSPPPAMPDAGPPQPTGPCSFDTGFPGDDACLLPPAPGEGIQIHIGPSRYDDPAEIARFTLAATDEREECYSFNLPNTVEAEYVEWEFSARPGLHHAVYTRYRVNVSPGQFDVCLDDYADAQQQFLGVMPVPTEPRVERRVPAPENESIAYPLLGNGPAQARLHHFNPTSTPVLRESWLNLYFPSKPPSERARAVQLTAGITRTMQPGEEVRVSFTCPISGAGRLLSLMARTSSATSYVGATLQRANGDRIPILEAAAADTPYLFSFDSATQNPPLGGTDTGASGAFTGLLEFAAGDSIEWTCQTYNVTNLPITHSNADGSGAICDLVGATTGSDVFCFLP